MIGKSAKVRSSSKSPIKAMRKRDEKAAKKQSKKIAKVEKVALKRGVSKSPEKFKKSVTQPLPKSVVK